MALYNLIYVGKFSDLDPVESFSIVSENQFDLNGRTFNPLSIVTLNAADAGLTWVRQWRTGRVPNLAAAADHL